MITIQSRPSHIHPGARLALLAGCLAAGLVAAHAAPPSLQPLLQGKWAVLPRGSANDVTVVGNYAYVALDVSGLAVFDVSNPSKCVPVGGYDTVGEARAVAVSGNYAYVASGQRWTGSNFVGSGSFQVIDVSNPTNCVRVGGYDRGDAYGVAVAGNYAYVAAWMGLDVIDVSNPANCVRVGGYNTTGYAVAVAVSGNYAYVAEQSVAGLEVIDVSNPTNCVRVGGYNSTNGYVVAVAVSGNYAYLADYAFLADYWAGFEAIDVSNPVNCVRVGGYDFRAEAVGVAVSANYAHVALESAGLAVIEVSNPAHCVRVGGYNTSGSAVAVAVSGNYAYVAEGIAGLEVIDVSSPANSVGVGGYDTDGVAYGVAVSGNHAYLADGDAGLQVIDVSDPTNCVRVGGYYTGGEARGVAVSGNYAYLADGHEGLQVIDVSDPTNCVRVGGYYTSGEARGVAVSGNYAYVAEIPVLLGCDANGECEFIGGGLRVIDISNPANPQCVGGSDTGRYAFGVAVWGNYAYVAETAVERCGARGRCYIIGGGLRVIDISNPANPQWVGGYDPSGEALGVAVVAGRIYVADGAAGLLVLPTLPNVQFTVRVDATPGVPFTLQATTNLTAPIPWTNLLTTNVPAMPFDYVDFDVKLSEKPQKYYRVRQP